MSDYLKTKLDRLSDIINGYGKMAVALSGGVDSVFLLLFAKDLWNDDRLMAATATGPHFAAEETEYASDLCRALNIQHKIISADDILSKIEENPVDRCYTCKHSIFSRFKALSSEGGFVAADGTNMDDMDDFRPGYRAICQLEIASPLKEAQLTKGEIRRALRDIASGYQHLTELLSNCSPASAEPVAIWDKPAFACLASRIPYGEKITVEKLEQIYRSEIFLREMGFHQVRVRHHDSVARIEVVPEERAMFFDTELMDQINDRLKAIGFRYAALDLGGYRMGNLNDEKK